ncbi:G1/S-specific cyclin-E-like [Ostrea edulis]|uniref:G1/S-specific cyclin-E-like n=1 Tax=Ostrea edulis TaxID=37623 RepID=UPI0020959646|nr:G1/S-specific cyclin-E-like [Ostrea edulis]XP_048779743.1 G1/S-specific cyclin-E-like [Ostrea edulis]
MSRKSARLLSKVKDEEESEVYKKIRRKRKADEAFEEDVNMNKRSKQFRIENQFIPISENSSITTCTLVPSEPLSPELDVKSSPDVVLKSQFRFKNICTHVCRLSPLPKFSWADSQEVWTLMLQKELLYNRNRRMFDFHPTLQARMRSILLDWIIEVCEVYRLHRETFYLSVDFIDRFLSTTKNVMKHQLQLVGITALFIAAKLEEIYPPKLAEFAYVTDGACSETEILEQELVILKELNWDLAPMTITSWLNVYLQVANIDHIVEAEHGFVFPQYSSHAFVQIARLTDLCILDMGCMEYNYSKLAAAALYYLTSQEMVLSVTGFDWKDMEPCIQWMAPFAKTHMDEGPVEVKFFPSIPAEDSHNIQIHAVDLNMLERAQEIQEEIQTLLRARSPDPQAQVITQLTPPHSGNKKSNTSKASNTSFSSSELDSFEKESEDLK